MNIFLTGGNGFIGFNIKQHLKNHFNIFAPTSQDLDIYKEKEVEGYILKNKIDIIIHAASKGGDIINKNIKNITEYNLRMFFNIVKHQKKVKKIISFGSGAEYGKHKPVMSVKEDDADLLMPFDEYGFYKSIMSKYAQKSKSLKHLRIFGCYGEYEDYKFKFISNAIVKNLLHLPIVINQNVFFDYLYIDDLVKIVEYFVNNESRYNIYNITSGQKIDLISLAKLINETSDFKSEITILKEGLNNEYTSDNNRLLNEIEKFNFTTHKDAIIKMRSYFKSIIETIDKDEIKKDLYLKLCDNFWVQKNE